MSANPLILLVPGAGVEPARSSVPRDFKSLMYTDSITRAQTFSLFIQALLSSTKESTSLPLHYLVLTHLPVFTLFFPVFPGVL